MVGIGPLCFWRWAFIIWDGLGSCTWGGGAAACRPWIGLKKKELVIPWGNAEPLMNYFSCMSSEFTDVKRQSEYYQTVVRITRPCPPVEAN